MLTAGTPSCGGPLGLHTRLRSITLLVLVPQAYGVLEPYFPGSLLREDGLMMLWYYRVLVLDATFEGSKVMTTSLDPCVLSPDFEMLVKTVQQMGALTRTCVRYVIHEKTLLRHIG